MAALDFQILGDFPMPPPLQHKPPPRVPSPHLHMLQAPSGERIYHPYRYAAPIAEPFPGFPVRPTLPRSSQPLRPYPGRVVPAWGGSICCPADAILSEELLETSYRPWLFHSHERIANPWRALREIISGHPVQWCRRCLQCRAWPKKYFIGNWVELERDLGRGKITRAVKFERDFIIFQVEGYTIRNSAQKAYVAVPRGGESLGMMDVLKWRIALCWGWVTRWCSVS